jgi:hypothetical protein
VINRIATPTPTKDTLDFYVDDLVHPALSICYNDLFSGKAFPFTLPLCGHAVGGNYCYFPILFQTHCRIVCRGKKMQFHQIGYRLYLKNTQVKSFSARLDPEERKALEQVASAWNQSLIPPMSKSITSSSGKVLLRAGGRIVGIELEPGYTVDSTSVIRIKFDGQLSVDCPITTFFGYALASRPCRAFSLEQKTIWPIAIFRCPMTGKQPLNSAAFREP